VIKRLTLRQSRPQDWCTLLVEKGPSRGIPALAGDQASPSTPGGPAAS
jgi:hypothetical protein